MTSSAATIRSSKTALTDTELINSIKQHTQFSVKPYESADSNKDRASFDDVEPNCFQVINTANVSEKVGEHWVGYASLPDAIVYFDSLGKAFKNNYYTIKQFNDMSIRNTRRKVLNVGQSYQDPDSSVCGHYVTLFAKSIFDASKNGLVADYHRNWLSRYHIVSGHDRRLLRQNDKICLREFQLLNNSMH